MEKFKKLNRGEMKSISGGQAPCPDTSYIVCYCTGPTDYNCLPSEDCATPAASCSDYCGGIYYSASGVCHLDDLCTTSTSNC